MQLVGPRILRKAEFILYRKLFARSLTSLFEPTAGTEWMIQMLKKSLKFLEFYFPPTILAFEISQFTFSPFWIY